MITNDLDQCYRTNIVEPRPKFGKIKVIQNDHVHVKVVSQYFCIVCILLACLLQFPNFQLALLYRPVVSFSPLSSQKTTEKSKKKIVLLA